MLSLGLGEILVIAALLVIVVGPERLPHMMRFAGRTYGQVRRAADDMRRAFVLEADRQDAEDRYKNLQAERKRLREEREALKAEKGEPVDAPVAFIEDLPPAAAPPEEATVASPEEASPEPSPPRAQDPS